MTALDETLRKIDDLSAKLEGKTIVTPEGLQAHIEAEIAKAAEETAEIAKARLAHLKDQIAIARKAFAAGTDQTAAIAIFDGHGQTKPTDQIVDTPPKTPAKNGIELEPDATVAKAIATRDELAKAAASDPAKAKEYDGRLARSIAKALEKDEALRTELAKADGVPEALREGVAKGMAGSMLSQVAAMFGFDPTSEDDMCGLGWKIGDVVRELERMAKVEDVMSRMAQVLGGTFKGDTATPPAPTPAAKAAGDDGFVWAMDLAADEPAVEREGVEKGLEEPTLLWGRDSEKAPEPAAD